MRLFLVTLITFLFLSCKARERAPIVEILPGEKQEIKERIDTLDIDVYSEIPVAEIKLEEKQTSHPKEDVAGKRNYSIQTGAFSQYKNASELKQELDSLLDYEVFIEIDEYLYKVRIGRFGSREEAENTINTIRKLYQSSFIVEIAK